MGSEPKLIVLTGGPCGGKTTCLSFLQEELMDRGWRVFVAPEVATTFIKGGLHDLPRIGRNDEEKYYKIQEVMFAHQMKLKERFLEVAEAFPEEDCVILFDRGPMDGKAFLPEEHADDWMDSIVSQSGYTMADARDDFDGVIHLVTAADGAEAHYQTDNNEARSESSERARYVDGRVQESWLGHPKLRVVDNSTDFEGKKKRVLRTVCSILGIPEPLEIERKFLLKDASIPNDARPVDIEQIYLESDDPDREIRIRKRTQDGCSTFYRTEKEALSSSTRIETERRISALDYSLMQQQADPDRGPVRKRRWCFTHERQYFELDDFVDLDLKLLEVELTNENDAVRIPPFVEVSREVTGDMDYRNSEIASGLHLEGVPNDVGD